MNPATEVNFETLHQGLLQPGRGCVYLIQVCALG